MFTLSERDLFLIHRSSFTLGLGNDTFRRLGEFDRVEFGLNGLDFSILHPVRTLDIGHDMLRLEDLGKLNRVVEDLAQRLVPSSQST